MISKILRWFGVTNVSKAIGAALGGLVGTGFATLVAAGLPPELASTEIQLATTGLLTAVGAGLVAWLFPANRKA